jgi:hypothetical protein
MSALIVFLKVINLRFLYKKSSTKDLTFVEDVITRGATSICSEKTYLK